MPSQSSVKYSRVLLFLQEKAKFVTYTFQAPGNRVINIKKKKMQRKTPSNKDLLEVEI